MIGTAALSPMQKGEPSLTALRRGRAPIPGADHLSETRLIYMIDLLMDQPALHGLEWECRTYAPLSALRHLPANREASYALLSVDLWEESVRTGSSLWVEVAGTEVWTKPLILQCFLPPANGDRFPDSCTTGGSS